MNRKKKFMWNTIFSLIYQLVTIISGFIIPHLMLKSFGSNVNGLISSITHFLSFIGLAECGIGAVVRSTLYKPLAEKNDEEISKIMISSQNFFHKIAYILIAYTVILMIGYPILVNTGFNFVYVASLILILSFSSFMQYYFSISYSILLTADGKGSIYYIARILTVVLNTIGMVVLTSCGCNIHFTKLVTSLIFLVQPIFLNLYVNRKYNLNKKIKLTEEPIKQKWNGLMQHIAAVVLGNTDIVVLTLFSTLESVSIYTVYNLVITGVKQIVTLAVSEVEPFLGNMYAKGENDLLNKTFSFIEWAVHNLVTCIYIGTTVLIIPFVSIYTFGIKDVNYIVPWFAFFITLSGASYCYRLPYSSIIIAAGHYKQTQLSALIEVAINIILSIVLVNKYGLVGVAIGTIVAMLYRTLYYVYYLKNNILKRNIKYFLKNVLVDLLVVIISVISFKYVKIKCNTYILWGINAIKVFLIIGVIDVIVNIIFYKKNIFKIYNIIINKFNKKKESVKNV